MTAYYNGIKPGPQPQFYVLRLHNRSTVPSAHARLISRGVRAAKYAPPLQVRHASAVAFHGSCHASRLASFISRSMVECAPGRPVCPMGSSKKTEYGLVEWRVWLR